ncbi:MAG: 3-oxoacyl-ACP reductase FabG [Ruminococcus sp.]|nr:3-oxoacyl-ACP reductase FabG [Ruminococcus sp.]
MKKAVVTGGAGGIGEAISRRLAGEGYFVYVCWSGSRDMAEELAAEIHGEAVGFDVADRKAVQETLGRLGTPDVLINNAGISEIGLFTHISEEVSSRILSVNLAGAMNCARAVLPGMIDRKSGYIINISSMWGQCGASCEVDYSASKAGLIGFTRALAKEVAPSGIRVNCIAPGFIMTEMNSRFTPDELETIRDEIPLGCFGRPEDIADAAAFLCSGQADYITGQVLAVNGGMVI